MNRIAVLCSLLALLLVSHPLSAADLATNGQAATAAAEYPAPLAKLELEEGDMIVFLGDSITHQCLYTQYVEDYFFTRMPGVRLKFHNSGVGGDKAADALARFDRDVAHYKPKYVTVLLGMNDGTYQPYVQEVFDTYRTGMLELISKIEGSGAQVVLMHPTMFDARAARIRDNGRRTPEGNEFYNSTLAYYGRWLQDVAYREGLGYVDMYGRLNALTLEARKKDPTFTLIPDAVHPEADGQLVMAFALLEDLGVPRRVSTVTIARGADDKPSAKAMGATVSKVQFTTDGVQFEVAAESLPLAVPDEAQAGAKLLRLGHRLSREALEIHGLPAGRYDLLIDGQKVGTYASALLEGAVELQENTATPQYQQALAVAELNRRRNDEAVRPLRDLWRNQKLLRVRQEQLKADPDNESLKKQVAAVEETLKTFEADVAALEAKSQELLDQIYEQNQPKVHQYQLVRVQAAQQQRKGRPEAQKATQ